MVMTMMVMMSMMNSIVITASNMLNVIACMLLKQGLSAWTAQLEVDWLGQAVVYPRIRGLLRKA